MNEAQSTRTDVTFSQKESYPQCCQVRGDVFIERSSGKAKIANLLRGSLPDRFQQMKEKISSPSS